MASYRKRSGGWQARITRKGSPDIAKTFSTKEAAMKWSRLIERDMDTGTFLPRTVGSEMTLSALISRYRTEVVPKLRGAHTEVFRLKTIELHLGNTKVASLNSTNIADYRDQRLKEVSASSCLRELQSLSAMLTIAQREWRIISSNPAQGIRKPSPNRSRERRLSPEEEARLMLALQPAHRQGNGRWGKGIRNFWLQPFVQLALQTAMRRGELLALRWEDINLHKRTAYLPITKNGNPRVVPLSTDAVQILERLPRCIDGRVFPMTANAVRQAWNRARVSVGLQDLHIHDLRHEATSRMAARLNVIELAAVTGHRDLRMLQRYCHPRAEELALKLG